MVILNAGISATGRFENIPPDAHRNVIAVNAEAPMVLCAGLARIGALSSGGTVIFISSLSHRTGYPGAASYAASKGAVAVYAKSIRKRFRNELGVDVACAFPGPMKTDHAARHAPRGARDEKRMTPDAAARKILRDAASGRAVIYPGSGAKLSAAVGRLLPGPVTRAMRRIIFEKLEGEVW
jgi:short-subunit dehydrogenase